MKKISLSAIFTLFAAVTLVSCGSKPEKTSVSTPVPQGKKRTYTPYSGPVGWNPTVNLSGDFTSQKVTHSRGLSSQPYIALTFDDGPHPVNTPRLLDMLKKRNVKATFYVVGNLVKRHPHIARRIVAEGHEIGNHTWTHGNLTKMTPQKVLWELDTTRDAIVSATGVQPRTMRPPYGALRTDQRNAIFNHYGYPTIMWSVDPLDWKRPGARVVAQRIVSNTRNGSIVLAHDLHKMTVDAMPETLDRLLGKGFQFVTVSQLLAQKSAQ